MAFDSEALWRRLWGLLLFIFAIGGYAGAYFSSHDLWEKLHVGSDVQKLLAILYILAFSAFIVGFLIYRFWIADRKEKFANIGPTLRSIVGHCKDLWNELTVSADAEGQLSPADAEHVLKAAIRRLQEICDEVAHVFGMLTGTHCRACIKVITQELDGQAYVIALARDHVTLRAFPKMDERRRAEKADPLAENSEFLRLANDEVPNYIFVSNDLSREPNFACTSINAYQLNHGRELRHRKWWERLQGDKWPLPYRSTITVALRNSDEALAPGEPSVVGFLAVDSESRGVFRRWDPYICSLVADALFHPVNMLLALMPDEAPASLAGASIEEESQSASP